MTMMRVTKNTAYTLLLLFPTLAYAVDWFAPDWIVPQNGMPYPTMQAFVGDTLTFSWSVGNHNVYIHPTHTCDSDGSILVATTTDNPTTYELTAQDGSSEGNVLTFVSQVGQQCVNGLYMNVTVFSGDPTDVPAPTEVPANTTATNAPTTGSTTAVTIPNSTEPVNTICFVCGNEFDTPIRGDTMVTLPSDQGDFFTLSCREVYEDGLAGAIPVGEVCEYVTVAIQATCGCAPANYTCNICDPTDSNGWTVRNKTAAVGVPGQRSLTCGELDLAGQNRSITPTECSILASLALVPCGCAPDDFNCSICGDNFQVTKSDVVVTLPSDEGKEYTCAELELLGSSGALNPAECEEAEFSLQSACGCAPITGFANCSICGEGAATLRPETELEGLSQGESVTCGEIQERGFAGLLNPTQCQAAQLAAALECSCAESGFTCNICGVGQAILAPDFNFTIPSSDQIYNCGELEMNGLDGRLSPNECTIIRPVATLACGCAPIGFICSICGEGKVPTNLNKAFVPQDVLTCGEIHAAGIAGKLTPNQCNLYSPLAQLSCGCEADIGATFPSPDGQPAMTIEPSFEAGNPNQTIPTEMMPTANQQEENSTTPNNSATTTPMPAAGSDGRYNSAYYILAVSAFSLFIV